MMYDCPICGSTTAEVLYPLREITIVRCEGCSIVSGRSLTTGELITEQYGEEYFTSRPAYREYVTGEVPVRREIATALIDIFSNWMPNSRNLKIQFLDFGSGAGFLTQAAEKRGYKSIGLDASPTAIRIAKTISQGEFVLGDMHTLDAWPKRFHAIGVVDTLEHLDDPVQALRALGRCLRPDGRIFVTVPGWGGWMSESQGAEYYHYTTDHKWFYSQDSLRQLVERAGLKAELVGRLAREFQGTRWEATEAGEKYINRRDHILAVVVNHAP